MQTAPQPAPATEVDDPPFLGSWRNMYIAVLVLHVVLIIFLYLLSRTYA